MGFRRLLAALFALFLIGACSDGKTYQVGIVKPLMVINTTPGGADDVPLDTELTGQFSDPVVEGSLTAETLVLAGPDAAAVEAAITYDGAENKVTLKPAKPLSYSTVYTLTFTKKIKRRADKSVLAKEVVHTFRTIDPPNLSVVESAPSGNATSIGAFVDQSGALTPYGDRVSSTVIVHFSEGIERKSVTPTSFTLTDESGKAVSGKFTWESTNEKTKDLLGNAIATDDILTFTPDAPLKLSTKYTVKLQGTFKGIISKRATESGGWFAENVIWTFRTIDPPPMRILWTTPSTDAVNVGTLVDPSGLPSQYGRAVSQTIVIRFSEGAATASVIANFQVVAADAPTVPVAGTITFSDSGPEFWQKNDTMTFEPATWSLSRRYIAVLGKAAETFRATATGGQLGQDFGLQFDTVNPPPLMILSTAPSNGAVNTGTLSSNLGVADPFGPNVAQSLIIRFSEGVDTISTSAALTVRTADTAAVVAGSISYTNSGAAFWQQNDTLVFTPTVWDISRNYTVALAASAKTVRATAVSGSLSQAFSMGFDSVDPLPLTLNSFSPGNGAGVSTTYINNGGAGNLVETEPGLFALTFQFSEDVQVAGADLNSFASNLSITDKLGATLVPSSIAFSGGGTLATVKIASLPLSSQIFVHINGGSVLTPYTGMASVRGVAIRSWYSSANDAAGFLADFDATFFTPDPPPLLLTSVSPSAATSGFSDNVDRASSFVLTFSEAVSSAVVATPGNYVTLTTGSSTLVPATYAFNGAATQLTITPTSPLLYSTVHQINILGGANIIKSWRNTGVSGSLTPSSATYQFKTLDPSVLTIWATSPSDNEDGFGISVSDVAVNSKIQILFDQAIDEASFAAHLTVEKCGLVAGVCSTPLLVAPLGITYVTYPAGAEKAVVDIGPMSFDTFFRVTVGGGPTGVVSVLNRDTCGTSCEGGYLPADYTISFGTRSIPPLRVTPVTPTDGESGVGLLPKIEVAFQSPVSLGTLTQYSFFLTDVTNNLLVKRFDGVSYYPVDNTASINLTGPLTFDTEYNIVLLSSVQGTDGRFLGREVRFSFHTKRASLVLDTDPTSGSSAIELNLSQRTNPGQITVFFDGAVTTSTTPDQSMSVTYVTSRGVAMLRGTVTVSGSDWIFDPSNFCTPGSDPLINNTTYWLTVQNTVWRADGSAQLSGGYKATFSTADYTLIGGVTATNTVPGNADLSIDLVADTDSIAGDGKDDVPVTSRFTVTFSEPVQTGLITYSPVANSASDTLLVQRSNGTYANLKNVSVSSTSVSFDADDPAATLVTNDLEFATSYTIILRETIRDLDGNPLSGDYKLSFTTSPAPKAWLVPESGDTNQKDPKYAAGVTFNVQIAPDSLTDSNFSIGEATIGCPAVTYVNMPALIDIGYDGRSAAILPSPIMGLSLCHNFSLLAGASGPRDLRGNPFPGPSGNGTAYTQSINSFSNDNGTTTITVAGAVPANGGTVAGRDAIRITATPSDNKADVLVTTVDTNSFWVYTDAARTLPVDGRVYFDQANNWVVFKIATGSYWQAGTTYYVKNGPSLSSSIRNNCTNCVNYSFVGESVAPTVTNITPTGAGAAANAAVVVTFSEGVRASTLTNLSVYPTGLPGSPVSGTWALSADAKTATFTAGSYYTGGVQYTVALSTGVQDYAGNALNTAYGDQTFTIENTAPDFSSATASVASVSADIDVTFTEDIALNSVLASLYAGSSSLIPGTVRFVIDGSGDPSDPLNNTLPGSEVFACVYVNGSVVTFDPIDTLLPATTYRLGIGPDGVAQSIEDLGGTPMAVTNTTFTFTTP